MLGVPKTASQDDLKKAYRKAATKSFLSNNFQEYIKCSLVLKAVRWANRLTSQNDTTCA
ncbi:hypothetical protein ACHM2F_16060 [Clostridium perfringens]